MLKPILVLLAMAITIAGLHSPARAQDANAPTHGKELIIDLGVGGRMQPKYAGAEGYLLAPFPIVQISYLRIAGLGTLADTSSAGLFFYPSFGFIGERSASDDADLTGLNTVDWAFEFGAGVGVRNDYFRAFVEARRGFNGHNGFVGELGIDAIIHPMEKVTLRAGPRLGLADNDYMRTYFGVTAAEAAASGGALAQYTPSGGIKDIGIEATASYAWTQNTSLHLEGGYRRLMADAASSPIVKRGTENQFSVGLGISHRFSFDFDGE